MRGAMEAAGRGGRRQHHEQSRATSCDPHAAPTPLIPPGLLALSDFAAGTFRTARVAAQPRQRVFANYRGARRDRKALCCITK